MIKDHPKVLRKKTKDFMELTLHTSVFAVSKKKVYGPTDGPTDERTDRWTDRLTDGWTERPEDRPFYKDARTHL